MEGFMNKIYIICGHYGTGKTNWAVNFAISKAKENKVMVVDLDIVNPYFRTADHKAVFEKYGIELIAPDFANSNLDIPSLSGEVQKIFTTDKTVIIDVGGDDAGAVVLGRFADRFKQMGYEMQYVINYNRLDIRYFDDLKSSIEDIENASHLKVNVLVNNTHLSNLTDEATILKGLEYAGEMESKLSIPVKYNLAEEKFSYIANTNPIKIYVKTLWDRKEEE